MTDTDTFTWLSDETQTRGELHNTVDFADILVAAGQPHSDDGRPYRAPVDSSRSLLDVLSTSDFDACDGILAQERLENSEWVDWTDVKRGLQRPR